MLKFLAKVIIASLIISGLAYYASYRMTGEIPDIAVDKPILSDIDLSELIDTVSKKFKSIREEESVKDTSLYKWRDAEGVIHYVSEKPSEEISYEEIILRSDTNVVPAISESETTQENIIQEKTQNPASPNSSNIYSPQGINNLFDQANDLQNLMNEQFLQQENNINGK